MIYASLAGFKVTKTDDSKRNGLLHTAPGHAGQPPSAQESRAVAKPQAMHMHEL